MRTLLTTLHSKYIHASLALPSLAAYCVEECGEILIREFTVHEPKENVLAGIMAYQPDVVAFSVYLWNRRETLELVAALAVVRPDMRIVLGGPEVSFEPTDFFLRHACDALICGEGEIPLRELLFAWNHGEPPLAVKGLRLAGKAGQLNTVNPLESLDDIPSPFAAGLVDLRRGFVYYETSRGCPYTCSFCMSSLDQRVRSYSMPRIREDLGLLMDSHVRKIKLVDRTFNYDAVRSREIFRFILEHNRSSHFHFEIGAHLLDEETLQLLETVPEGMFQFEIGVQSTLPETLQQIQRTVSLERLAENVRRLRRLDNIHLHLDLIAGLPGETFSGFLRSIDWVATLQPHHLQVEPVKLLPGAPLREQAAERNIRFDPNPPYTVLQSDELSYSELECLRGMGRLLDLLWNSGRFSFLLTALQQGEDSLSSRLQEMQQDWNTQGFFAQSLSLRQVFDAVYQYLQSRFSGQQHDRLVEALARDFAHSERVVPNSAPAYFQTDLTPEESGLVQARVRGEVQAIRQQGGKLQHFAAVFQSLFHGRRTVLLFLYLTANAEPMRVREIVLTVPDT